jgi:hypothetical protein
VFDFGRRQKKVNTSSEEDKWSPMDRFKCKQDGPLSRFGLRERLGAHGGPLDAGPGVGMQQETVAG